LASGSDDNTVRLWDAESGRPLASLSGHQGRVNTLSWSPDGQRLASGSWDNTVCLWDAQSGNQLASLSGHESPVWVLSWSPDGRQLRSKAGSGVEIFWDTVGSSRLPEQRDFHPGPQAEQSALIRAKATGGETVFFLGHRAVAWFPVSLDALTSPNGRTWVGYAGTEVYLLRLEGISTA
jgi:WD40 repeat protein